MLKDALKDAYIQVKIPKETKDKFYSIARENAQNPSALIRKWIEEFVKDEK